MALKLAIIASGQTQRAIARRARIEETRLSRMVRGQIEPFPRERKALARVLRRTEIELFPPVALKATA